MLSFLTRRSKAVRHDPHDRIRLSEDISVPFWIFKDPESRKKKVFWSIDRVVGDGFRRTLPSVLLFQLPEVIREVADIFAGLETEPPERRRQFARLSLAMAQIGDILSRDLGNGEDHGSSESERSQVLAV